MGKAITVTKTAACNLIAKAEGVSPMREAYAYEDFAMQVAQLACKLAKKHNWHGQYIEATLPDGQTSVFVRTGNSVMPFNCPRYEPLGKGFAFGPKPIISLAQKINRVAAAMAVSNYGHGTDVPKILNIYPTEYSTPRSEVDYLAGHLMETDDHEDMFAEEAESWAKKIRKEGLANFAAKYKNHDGWINQIAEM